jgi:hypothetical protein
LRFAPGTEDDLACDIVGQRHEPPVHGRLLAVQKTRTTCYAGGP